MHAFKSENIKVLLVLFWLLILLYILKLNSNTRIYKKKEDINYFYGY